MNLEVIHKSPIRTVVRELPGNAAMGVSMSSGELFVSASELPKYNESEIRAMACHENGHRISNSFDELTADDIGWQIFLRTGDKNYQATVSWMEKAFTKDNPEQMERLEAQKARVKNFLSNETDQLALTAGSTRDMMSGDKEMIAGVAVDPFSAYAAAASSGFNLLDGLFGGNKRDKEIAKSQQKAAEAQANAQIASSMALAKSQQLVAAMNANKTKIIVFALVAIAILAAAVYLLKRKKVAPVPTGGNFEFKQPIALPSGK